MIVTQREMNAINRRLLIDDLNKRFTRPQVAALLIEMGVHVTSGLNKWMLVEDLADKMVLEGVSIADLTPICP